MVEASGVLGLEVHGILHELAMGHRIACVSSEVGSLPFLVERISVAVQRGNTAAVLGTVTKDCTIS